MATVIQIKRSASATEPTLAQLSPGEMAYAQDASNDGASAKLYIESADQNGAVVHAVGGYHYTKQIDDATSAATPNTLVERNGLGAISADVTGALTGNATTATGFAAPQVINFVDTGVGDISGTISFDGTSAITAELSVTGAEASELKGNVLSDSGLVSILDNGTAADGSDATFKGDVLSNDGLVTILDNGTDGTDAVFTGDVTGDLTGNSAGVHTGNVTGDLTGNSAGVHTGNVTGDLTGDSAGTHTGNVTGDLTGNSAGIHTGNVTGDLTGNSAGTHTGAVVGNASTATALATSRNFSAAGADVSAVATGFDGTGDVVLDMVLQPTGVTAATVGSAGEVPILTIDANGRITSTSTATITTAFDIADGVGGTDNVPGGETLTFEGTANEITTAVTNNKVKMSLPTNVSVLGKLTVGADLEVAGSVTSVNTTDLEVTDALIRLGKDNSSNALDIGFVGQLNDGTDKYTGLYRTAGGNFHLFDTEEDLATAQTVDRNATGYTVATMVANLTGDVTGDVEGNLTGNVTGNLTGNVTGDVTGDIYAVNGSKVLENGTDGTDASYTGSLTGGRVHGLSQAIDVADGGTGATTHTANQILFGNGTGALQSVGGSEGHIMVLGAGGVPQFLSALDGGSF